MSIFLGCLLIKFKIAHALRILRTIKNDDFMTFLRYTRYLLTYVAL